MLSSLSFICFDNLFIFFSIDDGCTEYIKGVLPVRKKGDTI